MCLGIPGRIVSIAACDPIRRGMVEFGGVSREVCLACVPEAGVNDWVIVHVGFAISHIDEADARETLEALRSLGELDSELQTMEPQ